MPSFTATPATIGIAGGAATFIPARFSATTAALRIVGGTAGFTIGGETAVSVTTPRLPRLERQQSYFDKDGRATAEMQLRWQRAMEAIETAFAAVDVRDDNQDSILARLAATEAQVAAAQEQSAATAAADALAKSYPTPSDLLSASSSGTITITAHTRVYGDGTSVLVNAGSVSGFAQGSYVQVYYDDAGRAGGAVSYQGTLELISQTGARHIIGGVSIPLAGSPPVDGFPPFPPGYVREFPA